MKYFIIAGEASGDLHASNLMHELKRLDPQADFLCLGGDKMAAQGGRLVRHYRDMAFMGFVSVLRNWHKISDNFRYAKQALLDYRPDVVILVDYPSFNLKMAKFVKKHLPETPVDYYISPKLWAWKTFRIKSIKKYIDHMYTIFPFETEFYARFGYQVDYVGNPTQEVIAERPGKDEDFTTFVERNNLEGSPIIALLAGSRIQEIDNCLPRMIQAATAFPNCQPVIAGAPGIEPAHYAGLAGNVPVLFGQTYELLQQARATIVNSGTATLETALIGTPQVVVYHAPGGRFTMLMKKLFIKTKYISLVNIIAGQEIVRELIAHLFTAGNVQTELAKLLHDETYRNNMRQAYLSIKENIGNGKAAQTAATLIINRYKK